MTRQRAGNDWQSILSPDSFKNKLLPSLLAAVLLLLLPAAPPSPREDSSHPKRSFIVQGSSIAELQQAVLAVDGEISHELPLINAVAAWLDAEQVAELAASRRGRIASNPSLTTTWTETSDDLQGNPSADVTANARLVGADRLHREGLIGTGITIAILDSGISSSPFLRLASSGRQRLLARYNAITDQLDSGVDRYGHGSHIASVIASSHKQSLDGFAGMAPDADLVVVKAFDDQGRGSYADVIRGLGWIVANQSTYGIRLVNLSFGTAPRSFYWDDPLNQAVMAAWRAGVAVVVSAGNDGPDPMTITVPGNVPYVITAGAISDNRTPNDSRDDVLTAFSASGPTAEGFVKPELVSPGSHVPGLVDQLSWLRQSYPEAGQGLYFDMSGTSQAAAIVSGVAALVLQADPWLAPDDLKCRLMAGARAAVDPAGQLLYSPFQQGAGLIDAYAAVHARVTGCANRGLDIDLDLAGIEHYSGPARYDREQGSFSISQAGYAWDGGYFPSASTWTGGSPGGRAERSRAKEIRGSIALATPGSTAIPGSTRACGASTIPGPPPRATPGSIRAAIPGSMRPVIPGSIPRAGTPWNGPSTSTSICCRPRCCALIRFENEETSKPA